MNSSPQFTSSTLLKNLLECGQLFSGKILWLEQGGGAAIFLVAIVLEPIKLKFVFKNIILKKNTFWQSPAMSFFVSN